MPLETIPFDAAEYLTSEEAQIELLKDAIEEGDPTYIAHALGVVARARGVSEFARETGLSREAIYKAFRPGGNPTLDTLTKATKALGLKLTLVAP
ncbi:putative addiction module antidote protein [Bosea sp. F3-2]|uniref:addiction module antidote protein n=1 Tax=Bosea sp. F3-2 TaxID=2599640 RepID=UPI0011ECAB1B|nr:addiction module antidote protein [Bosea sp. F3-2]QEL21327.1 putative addiction module antidote protein [Bosea sp. F3-2]